MARTPDARAQQAKELFLSGKKLIDIAEQLGVSEGTVRSWKSRYDWDGNATLHNTNRNVAKEKSVKKKSIEKPVVDEVESVLRNPDLTDKQRLFCLYFVKNFNATKSYQKAYGCSYDAARAEGYKALANPCIKAEIQRLKRERMAREFLSEEDIFQKYMDIAFADITDFVEFGQEEEYVVGQFGLVQVEDPVTGKKTPLKQKVNTVKFRDSAITDGTLITEVKHGRNGASIKLADRMKALDWLADHMDIVTEEQKARIAVLKTKAAGDVPEEVDTSFVDALKDLAAKVWDDAEEEN